MTYTGRGCNWKLVLLYDRISKTLSTLKTLSLKFENFKINIQWLIDKNVYKSILLTQKYSTLNPGIFLWLAPIWCKNSKKASRSSNPLMPSSSVCITLLACSASSIELACSSLVFSSLNFSNMFSRSLCSSNSLQIAKRGKKLVHSVSFRCLKMATSAKASTRVEGRSNLFRGSQFRGSVSISDHVSCFGRFSRTFRSEERAGF